MDAHLSRTRPSLSLHQVPLLTIATSWLAAICTHSLTADCCGVCLDEMSRKNAEISGNLSHRARLALYVPQAGSLFEFQHSTDSTTMATAVSAQLVNLSAKAELKLVEAVASSMPSGQVCVHAAVRLV